MKSRGLPEPLADLAAETGTGLGFDAAKSWSRKRYRAASTTPRDRIIMSEEELMAMAGIKWYDVKLTELGSRS